MVCPGCARAVTTGNPRCPSCGTALPPVPGAAAGDAALLRLGPFGVSISRRRPGLLVPVVKNCTEVVATEQRLLGLRRPGCLPGLLRRGAGTRVFEVPYRDVLALERADFLGNRAIWLAYRTPAGTRELGVVAALTCHGQAERLFELLGQRVAAARGQAAS